MQSHEKMEKNGNILTCTPKKVSVAVQSESFYKLTSVAETQTEAKTSVMCFVYRRRHGLYNAVVYAISRLAKIFT